MQETGGRRRVCRCSRGTQAPQALLRPDRARRGDRPALRRRPSQLTGTGLPDAKDTSLTAPRGPPAPASACELAPTATGVPRASALGAGTADQQHSGGERGRPAPPRPRRPAARWAPTSTRARPTRAERRPAPRPGARWRTGTAAQAASTMETAACPESPWPPTPAPEHDVLQQPARAPPFDDLLTAPARYADGPPASSSPRQTPPGDATATGATRPDRRDVAELHDRPDEANGGGAGRSRPEGAALPRRDRPAATREQRRRADEHGEGRRQR